MKRFTLFAILLALASLTPAGVTATRTTAFVHPEYDFGQVERVAVVPFENLSSEQGTASYVSRVFLTELLATGAFDVVEPGEVSRVINSMITSRSAELSHEQLKKAGTELGVQVLIFGTVGESAEMRSSSGVNSHVISLDVRMVDAESGVIIWSALVNTGGPGVMARVFGAGDQSRGGAVRKAVRKAITTLVK